MPSVPIRDVWNRVRGLINPMLYYYWLNIGRELGIIFKQASSPAELVVKIATHNDRRCREKLNELTKELAGVNPDLLRRFVKQVRLSQSGVPESNQVAKQIEKMLED